MGLGIDLPICTGCGYFKKENCAIERALFVDKKVKKLFQAARAGKEIIPIQMAVIKHQVINTMFVNILTLSLSSSFLKGFE